MPDPHSGITPQPRGAISQVFLETRFPSSNAKEATGPAGPTLRVYLSASRSIMRKSNTATEMLINFPETRFPGSDAKEVRGPAGPTLRAYPTAQRSNMQKANTATEMLMNSKNAKRHGESVTTKRRQR